MCEPAPPPMPPTHRWPGGQEGGRTGGVDSATLLESTSCMEQQLSRQQPAGPPAVKASVATATVATMIATTLMVLLFWEGTVCGGYYVWMEGTLCGATVC